MNGPGYPGVTPSIRRATYGTQGTAASSNVPGAREAAVSWLDSNGKLWLFGGSSNGDWLNDLWKYDPATLEWTWISGSNTAGQAGNYGSRSTAATSNIPGAREAAVSWLDSSGNLWLLGGYGLDSSGNQGWLNDLWEFNLAILEWIWVSGSNTVNQAGTYGTQGAAASSNVPGAREAAVSWLDSSGNLWLFGGLGSDSAGNLGILNDVWKYNPATFEWAWISGSNTVNQTGNYGTQGTAASSNVPGARFGAATWLDSYGKLWLFGGSGFDSVGSSGYLNDLWKYDPGTLEWTWISGGHTIYQVGIYGIQGTAASSNVPGARSEAVTWLDSSGLLWLFGGGSNLGSFNDLWKYDPGTLEWTWISGSDTVNQSGDYGTQGTATSSNVPGARSGAVTWLDSSGLLWLFGGTGLDSAGNGGVLNDLWKYTR